MNWKSWLARDGCLWVLLFYVGLAVNVALPMMADPAQYGISPVAYKWMVLVNAVITAIAGKFGMSPLELARNQGGTK